MSFSSTDVVRIENYGKITALSRDTLTYNSSADPPRTQCSKHNGQDFSPFGHLHYGWRLRRLSFERPVSTSTIAFFRRMSP